MLLSTQRHYLTPQLGMMLDTQRPALPALSSTCAQIHSGRGTWCRLPFLPPKDGCSRCEGERSRRISEPDNATQLGKTDCSMLAGGLPWVSALWSKWGANTDCWFGVCLLSSPCNKASSLKHNVAFCPPYRTWWNSTNATLKINLLMTFSLFSNSPAPAEECRSINLHRRQQTPARAEVGRVLCTGRWVVTRRRPGNPSVTANCSDGLLWCCRGNIPKESKVG